MGGEGERRGKGKEGRRGGKEGKGEEAQRGGEEVKGRGPWVCPPNFEILATPLRCQDNGQCRK